MKNLYKNIIKYLFALLVMTAASLILLMPQKSSAAEVNISIDSAYMYNNSSEIVQGDYGKITVTDSWPTDIAVQGVALLWEYTTDRPDIVSIDNQGNYTALAQGVANIEIKLSADTSNITFESEYDKWVYESQYSRSYEYTFYVSADASMVVPDVTNVTLYTLGRPVQVHLSNIPVLQYYKFDYSCKEGMYVDCSFDSASNTLTFSSYYQGSGNVTITLNNAKFKIYVTIK